MYDLPVNYERLDWKERRAVRNQYVVEQGQKCFHCGESLNEKPPEKITKLRINWKLFPDNFLKYPIHLQHNHKNGMTEGAVHNYCNAVLWQYHGR